VENYCWAIQATDDNRRKRIACWITKRSDTHTIYIRLVAYPRQ